MAHLVKFRFWYICGICMAGLLANWFLLKQNIDQARTAGQKKIEDKIGEIDRVLAVSVPIGKEGSESVKVHPNEETKKGMQAEIARSMDQLLKAWEKRRKAQEQILVWPANVIESDDFVKKFREYDPPEKFLDIKTDAVMDGYCLSYSQQIPKNMPLICDIIRARWAFEGKTSSTSATTPVDDSGSGGLQDQGRDDGDRGQGGDAAAGSDDPNAGDGGQDNASNTGDPPSDPPSDPPADPPTDAAANNAGQTPALKTDKPVTVVWNPENQALWNTKLTRFRGVDGTRTDYPTGYQVLALQQDLWLLEAMFRVISTVNGDVLANDLAPISQIYYVVFGREARSLLGSVMPPDARKSTAGPVGPGGVDVTGLQGAGAAGQAGAQTDPATGAAVVPFNPNPPVEFNLLRPFHGRYVDANFQPVPIERFHAALASPAPPTADLEFIVAKRVPFRVAFRMSEKRIPDFIAACSNSPFEFEVAQVRINRYDPSTKFNAGSGASESTTAGTPQGNDLNSSMRTGKDAAEARINDNVDVEFYGVVRIYNPVDPARIKLIAGDAVTPPGT